MSTRSDSPTVPRYNEGKQYWQDLSDECQAYVECVNATLLGNMVDPAGLLQYFATAEILQITKPGQPTVSVRLTMNYHHWGPVISARYCGEHKDGKKFLPQEFELPIAIDRDDEIVAIFDEGRSFSPHEVASYLMRYFHSCYPAISFPC